MSFGNRKKVTSLDNIELVDSPRLSFLINRASIEITKTPGNSERKQIKAEIGLSPEASHSIDFP